MNEFDIAVRRQACVPPGLPRPQPTVSYWQSPEDDIAHTRTTDTLPSAVDVVIVGAGISGASIALNLLTANPQLQILMLEARQAASGASGRNGGHTKHVSYKSFAANMQHHGEDEATKIARLEYNCMVAAHDFIKQHELDCDSRRLDTVDVYYDEELWSQAHTAVQLMQKVMGTTTPITDYTFYDAEETATRFFAPNAVGALRCEAGSLSAYKLTVGILKLALSKGLNLQTDTAATGIEKMDTASHTQDSALWQVRTQSRGTIQTPKLILATNGYTAHLYPALQGNVLPVRGVVTAQRPGKSMPTDGPPATYSFVYSTGYEYQITRPPGSTHAGDIVIGGGFTKSCDPQTGLPDGGLNEIGNADDTTYDPAVEEYLTQSLVKFFGEENWGQDHPDGRVRNIWSGIMGYSADSHPFVGPVPGEPGLFLDVSFQGHGMVLCLSCADAVAKMVLASDLDDKARGDVERELDTWFPRCYRVTQERIDKKFSVESYP